MSPTDGKAEEGLMSHQCERLGSESGSGMPLVVRSLVHSSQAGSEDMCWLVGPVRVTSSSCRIQKYNSFKNWEKRLLVATDLFGRGIDIQVSH